MAKDKNRRHLGGIVILHEDRDILVIDKPEGLLTVATDKEERRTVYALLTDYVRKGASKSRERVFIVHRLDQGTSGVMVFARSEGAKRFLQENWDKTGKTYLALLHGHLPEKEGIMTSYLAENSARRVYSTPDAARGKLARTAYRVIRETARYSLVEVDLLTGRKNQIRVHFSEKGHPVAGDKKYGNKKDGQKRLALHARTLTLKHPHNGREMTFEAPLPPLFEALLGRGEEEASSPQ